MGKKTILHIINSLTRGGAEIQLRNSINILPEFNHVVVYLYEPRTIISSFAEGTDFICLEHSGWSAIWRTVNKIKRIIAEKEPVIVHSHLFTSTICARLATLKHIPLVSTLHSIYSIDAFKQNKLSLIAEKFLVREWHSLIAVSNYVLHDYLKYVNFKGKKFVHYNFIPDEFFNINGSGSFSGELKCIAIGNLKEAKNYRYMLKIFNNLKDQNVSIDIIGEGLQREELQKIIDEQKLPVKLLGAVENIQPLFKNYNLFIQASGHEGFGLSVIEAMASGLPVLLSDIPVFHEITNENAHFFPLNSHKKASNLIMELKQNEFELNKYKNEAFEYCIENYNVKTFRKNLFNIYNKII